MPYVPGRCCEQCGAESPYSAICGECETASKVAASLVRDIVIRLRSKASDTPTLERVGLLAAAELVEREFGDK